MLQTMDTATATECIPAVMSEMLQRYPGIAGLFSLEVGGYEYAIRVPFPTHEVLDEEEVVAVQQLATAMKLEFNYDAQEQRQKMEDAESDDYPLNLAQMDIVAAIRALMRKSVATINATLKADSLEHFYFFRDPERIRDLLLNSKEPKPQYQRMTRGISVGDGYQTVYGYVLENGHTYVAGGRPTVSYAPSRLSAIAEIQAMADKEMVRAHADQSNFDAYVQRCRKSIAAQTRPGAWASLNRNMPAGWLLRLAYNGCPEAVSPETAIAIERYSDGYAFIDSRSKTREATFRIADNADKPGFYSPGGTPQAYQPYSFWADVWKRDDVKQIITLFRTFLKSP